MRAIRALLNRGTTKFVTEIQAGYFRDFLGTPEALLVAADEAGLRALGEFAAALALGQPASLEAKIAFHRCPDVVFEVGEGDEGLRKVQPRWVCRWTKATWASIAEQVESMVGHGPCHHFVDAGRQRSTVILSTGEYDLAWWGTAV